MFLVFTTLYTFVPWLRKPLVREHNVLETFQIILYLSSVVWVFRNVAVIRQRQPKWLYRLILVLGVFAFLEEVSYGETIFLRFTSVFSEAPTFYGVKIDAIHDFGQVFYVAFTTAFGWSWTQVLGLSLGIVFIFLLILNRFYDIRGVRKIVSQYPPMEFIVICGVLLLCAAFFDLEVSPHHAYFFVEEFLETLAALALFFSALATRHGARSVMSG